MPVLSNVPSTQIARRQVRDTAPSGRPGRVWPSARSISAGVNQGARRRRFGSSRAAPRRRAGSPSRPSRWSGNETNRSRRLDKGSCHAGDGCVHRHVERIGGDLRQDGFDPLADRGRADIDRHEPSASSTILAFPRPGGAALDEAADREALMPAVDHGPCRDAFAGPAELLQAAIEGRVMIAAVEFLRFAGGDTVAIGYGISLAVTRLRRRNSTGSMPRSRATISNSRSRKKSALKPPRPAIRADRGLVGQQNRGLDVNVRDAIGPDMNCATLRGLIEPAVRR